MALNFVGKPGIDDRQAKLIESMYQGTELAPQVAEGFTVRDEVYNGCSPSRPSTSELSFCSSLLSTSRELGFSGHAWHLGNDFRRQTDLSRIKKLPDAVTWGG
jgi:hypothetical protein